MSEQGIKTSQRVSRSCVECGRRKIKCDKKVPCKPCIRRNLAHQCQRPITRVRGQLTVASVNDRSSVAEDSNVDDLLKERCALQAQIAELETALALSKPYAHSHVGKPDTTSPPDGASFEDIVPALEQFDLGVTHDDGEFAAASEKEIARQLYEPSTDPLFLLLPSRETSDFLVTNSLSSLGWVHGAVDAPSFLDEHGDFWDKIVMGVGVNPEDRPWLAVYFALLATGLLYLDPDVIPITSDLPQLGAVQSGNEVELAVHTSRIWYEVALKEIERCACSGSASLHVVQALSILTLCHSNFGEHQREWILAGLATNMARCLDMHRLGSELAHSPDLHKKWSTPAQRELGRRLWWTYVVRDWLGIWSRSPSISPASFCCQFSVENKVNHNVLPDPSPNATTPSPLHYQSVMSRLAYIFYIYIKVNTHHTASKLTKAMDEIQSVRRNLPLHLSPNFPANIDDEEWESEHPWVPFQRYLITHALHFMHLSIARTLAMAGITNDSDKYRSAALESATYILNSYIDPVPRVYKLVWTVSASTVAASIYLSLDILMNPHEYSLTKKQDHIKLLQLVAQELREYSTVAIHASKGSSFLQRLLQSLTQEQPIAQQPQSAQDILRQLSARDVPVAELNMTSVSANTPQSNVTGLDSWDEMWNGENAAMLHTNDDYLHEIMGRAEAWDNIMDFPTH